MRIGGLLLAACLLLTACNTIEGVSRDVQAAGKAVEKGAKKTKRAIFD